ncbi:hypothetical protein D3C80_1468900 [compost metagenome]
MSSGQFDGQGNAIQPLADVDHQRYLAVGQFEVVTAGHRPFGKQLQRRVLQGGIALDGHLPRRERQGVQALHVFAFGAQAFAAGGQDVQVRGAAQQGFAEQGDGVDQVLAVVDHQQQMPLLELPGDGVQWITVLQWQVEQCAQVGGDHGRVVERCQVQQMSAVTVVADQPFRDPQGNGGLADAAGADQGNEAFSR